MAKSPLGNNTGRPSDQKAEFILIKLGYSCQLLFPMEAGNRFLEAYSQAREWKSDYKEPTVIIPSPPEISVRYITQHEIAKIQFDNSLGGGPE